MIVSDFFTQVNAAYRGTDDSAPASGTANYTLWLDTTNRKINEWATDSDNTWQSLFENRSIGAITTSLTYNLDDDFMTPSDLVRVVTTAAQNVDYTIVKPQERGKVSKSVYISGADPQVLHFYDTIATTDSIYGGTLYVPGYFLPSDLTGASDTIPVDDPYWLVYAVAAELAFNELTYADKAADLTAKANNLWSKMVKRNRKGTNDNPRTARTSVTRITGFR